MPPAKVACNVDNSEFDIGAGAASAAPGLSDQLTTAVKQVEELELAAANLEDTLKATKSLIHNIRTQRIPELMNQIGTPDMVVGEKRVVIKDFVSGSLPSDPVKRAAAIAHLEKNEGGDLLKTEVKLAFGRQQHEEAKLLAESLIKQGFTTVVESGVHSQTLCAWARTRMKEGKTIDTDVLGLFTGKIAEIKEPKKK